MDDIFVYFVPFPPTVHEMVTPCADGYTIYIADWLDEAHRIKAYEHALDHIRRNDFEKDNVQEIEMVAHGLMEEKPAAPPPVKKKRKHLSKYEKYIRKMEKRREIMESFGLQEHTILVDDEYGCTTVLSFYQ